MCVKTSGRGKVCVLRQTKWARFVCEDKWNRQDVCVRTSEIYKVYV